MSTSSFSRRSETQDLPTAVLAYTSVPHFSTARTFSPPREPDASALRPSVRKLEPLNRTASVSTPRHSSARILSNTTNASRANKVVRELIKLRKRLGWQSKLPTLGRASREEIRRAIDAPNGIVPEDPTAKQDGLQHAAGLLKKELDVKEDDGRCFHAVLLNQQPADRYDPYDLMIVDALEAEKHRFRWTFSASSVCSFEHNVMIDLEPAMQWLWDYQIFSATQCLRTFVNFKMWRTFQFWRHTVRREKMENRLAFLEKTLFFADELYYGCLYHVRSMIQSAIGSEAGSGDEANDSSITRRVSSNFGSKIVLVRTDPRKTTTLDEFMTYQVDTALPNGVAQLRELEKRIVQLVSTTCIAVARQEQLLYAFDGGKMTFCEQQTVKSLCKRFKDFFKLIDNLLVDFRHRLIARTIGEIAEYFDASGKKLTLSTIESATSIRDEMTLENLTRKQKHTKAIFYVDLTLHAVKLNKRSLSKMTDQGVEEEYLGEELEEGTSNQGDSADQKESGRPNVNYSLLLIPQRNDCRKQIVGWIESIEQQVSMMQELCEHESLRMFSPSNFDVLSKILQMETIAIANQISPSVLTEEGLNKSTSMLSKDETDTDGFSVGASNSESVMKLLTESSTLSLATYLDSVLMNDDRYQDTLCNILNVFDESFDKLESHTLEVYTRYRDMVNEGSRFDEDYFSRLDYVPEDLKGVLARFSDHIAMIRSMPLVKRVEILRLRADQLQQAALPHLTRVISVINNILPNVAIERNNRLLEVIQSALKKLDAECETIDDFVEQLNFLERTASQIGELESECAYVTKLFNVLLEFDLTIDPTQKALFRTLNAQFLYLKNVTTSAEAHRDERIAKFTLELRRLIAAIKLAPIKSRLLQDASMTTDSYKSGDGAEMADGRTSVDEEDEIILAVKLLDGLNAIRAELEPIHARINHYIEYEQRFIQILEQTKAASKVAVGADRVQLPSRQVSELLEQHSLLLTLKREYEELNQIVQSRSLLWSSIIEWKSLAGQYAVTRLYDLKVKDVASEVNRMLRDCNELLKRMPRNYHLLALRDRVTEFSRTTLPVITALHNPAMKAHHFGEIEAHIRTAEVDAAKRAMRNLAQLNLRAYKLNNSQILVKELAENGILKYKDFIQEVSITASNEIILEQQFEAMVTKWQQTNFRIIKHSSRNETLIFSILNFDDLLIQSDDSLLALATLKTNRYVEPIKQRLVEWETKMVALARAVGELQQAQKTWRKLEPIFTAADIQRQLVSETKLYQMTERSLIDFYVHKLKLDSAQAQVTVLRLVNMAGYTELLQMCNRTFEKLERSLDDYLDSKRQQFARFYFISNAELIDILSKIKDPLALQPYLPKMFANVCALVLHDSGKDSAVAGAEGAAKVSSIESLLSTESERLAMPRNTKTRGPVEQWMNVLEQTMFDTVKRHIKLCLADAVQSQKSLGVKLLHESLVGRYVSQAAGVACEILFSKNVKAAVESTNSEKALEDLDLALRALLIEYTNAVNHRPSSREGVATAGETGEMSGRQSKPNSAFSSVVQVHSGTLPVSRSIALETLLLQLVHQLEMVANLRSKRVTKLADYNWLKCMRYDWDEVMNTCSVLQLDATFAYGYEYLGARRGWLVITPLTDRCMLSLTNALSANYCAVMVGQRESGKTQTVHELARLLGKQLVAISCASSRLNYRAAWKMISGVVQTGAWCLLEEINGLSVRLDLLSFVARLLGLIKQTKDAKLPRVLLENRELRCVESCQFFTTLVPQLSLTNWPLESPSVFRPVSRSAPNMRIIIEGLLLSFGFDNHVTLAETLGQLVARLTTVKLRSGVLGMRTISTVVQHAGCLRRESLHNREVLVQLVEHLQPGAASSVDVSGNRRFYTLDEETCILVHCLVINLVPQLSEEVDRKQFWRVMIGLFPSQSWELATSYFVKKTNLSQLYYEQKLFADMEQFALDKAIALAFKELQCFESTAQASKAHQLYDILKQRQCCVLLGETGSCKTTIRNILQRALTIIPTIIVEDFDNLLANRRRGKQTFSFSLNRSKKAVVEAVTISPNFLDEGLLYGRMEAADDASASEWTDGVFNKFLRKYLHDNTLQRLQKLTTHLQGEAALRGPTELTVLSSRAGDGVATATAASPVDQPLESERSTAPSETQMSAEKTCWYWIVFDGSIDSRWADRLTHYLDENANSRVFTAADGNRYLGNAQTCLMFELDDANDVSPAFLSRCATLHFDRATCFDWKLFASNYLLTQLAKSVPHSMREHFMGLLTHSFEKGIAFLRRIRNFVLIPMNTIEQVLLTQLLSIVVCLVNYLADRVNIAQVVNLSRPDSGANTQFLSGTTPLPASGSRLDADTSARSGEQSETVARTGRYFIEKFPQDLNTMLTKIYIFAFTSSIGASFERIAETEQELAVLDNGQMTLSTWVQREMRIQNANSPSTGAGDNTSIDTFLSRSKLYQIDRERKRQLNNVRLDFDALIMDLFDCESNRDYGVTLPASANSFSDYFIDLVSGEFVPYETYLFPGGRRHPRLELGEVTKLDSDDEYRIQLEWLFRPEYVVTPDALRNAFLAMLLIKGGYNVLLSGPIGVGKTTLINRVMNALCGHGAVTNGGATPSDGKSPNVANESTGKDKIRSSGAKSDMVFHNIVDKLLHSVEKNQLVESPAKLRSRTSSSKHSRASSRSSGVESVERVKITSYAQTRLQLTPGFKTSTLFNSFKRQLVKRSREAIGPATKGQQLLVFLDDLHLVQDESVFDCFRQLTESHGFFDADKLGWIDLENCSNIFTSGPIIDNARYQPYASDLQGRRTLRTGTVLRLLRRFCVLNMQQISVSTLQTIVQHQLNRFWMELQFSLEVREALVATSHFLVNVYQHCARYFLPNLSRSFACFSLHDFWFTIARCFYMQPQFVRSREVLSHFLAHESLRIFSDRLLSAADRELFSVFLLFETQTSLRLPTRVPLVDFMAAISERPFGYDSHDGHHLQLDKQTAETEAHLNGLRRTHTYQQMTRARCAEMSAIEARFFLKSCPKHADFIVYKAAAERLFGLVRLLKSPKCCCAVFGRSGLGKHKLLQLASAVLAIEIAETDQPASNVRDFLRSLLRNAFLENHNYVLIVDDYSINQAQLMEGIMVLSSFAESTLHFFYSHTELDELLFQLNTKMVNQTHVDSKKSSNFGGVETTSASPSRDDLIRMVVQRLCLNVRIVFLLDPLDERTSRVLVNYSTVFSSLPKMTLSDDLDETWLSEIAASVIDSLAADLTAESRRLYKHSRDAVFSSVVEKLLVGDDGKSALTRCAIGMFQETKKFTKLFDSAIRKIRDRETRRSSAASESDAYAPPAMVKESQFIEMLQTFRQLTTMRVRKLLDEKSSLLTGLKRLKNTKSTTIEMQQHLEALAPQIAEQTAKATQMLTNLRREETSAREIQSLLQNEDARLQSEHEAVDQYRLKCETEVRAVLPILEQATSALGELSKQSIAEVRAYTYPPAAVVNVMSAICTLLDAKPDWLTARQLMVDPNRFLAQLINYDRDNVSNKVFANLKRIVNDPHFNPEVVGNVSMACRSLCEWVIAITKYVEVAKMAKPKRDRFDEATRALSLVNDNFGELQRKTQHIEALLRELAEKHAEAQMVCEKLAKRHALLEKRLVNARRLMEELDSSCAEWVGRVEAIDNELMQLLTTSLLRAAAVTFSPSLSVEQRRSLFARWFEIVTGVFGEQLATLKAFNSVNFVVHEVPLDQSFDLLPQSFDLVSATWSRLEQLEMQVSGLPSDNYVRSSAALVTTLLDMDSFASGSENEGDGVKSSQFAPKFPFVIDAHQIAVKWLSAAFVNNVFIGYERMQFVSAAEKNYVDVLLQSLEQGNLTVLRDVESVGDEHALANLLYRLRAAKLESRSGAKQVTVELGDGRSTRFNPQSRLVLASACKISNPSTVADFQKSCCIVPFELTFAGLNDELLKTISMYSNRQQRDEIVNLIIESMAASVTVEKLRRVCLDRLLPAGVALDDFEAEEDMLFDDESLLENLDEYLSLRSEMHTKIERAEELGRLVQESMRTYREAAANAASLYQAVRDLHVLDPSYRLAFDAFQELFNSIVQGLVGQQAVSAITASVPPAVRNPGAFYSNITQYSTHYSITRRPLKSASSAAASAADNANYAIDAPVLSKTITASVLPLLIGGLKQSDVEIFSFLLVCELMRTNNGGFTASGAGGTGDVAISDLEWSVFVDHITSTVAVGNQKTRLTEQILYLEVLEFVSEVFAGVAQSLKAYLRNESLDESSVSSWSLLMSSEDPYGTLKTLQPTPAVKWHVLTNFQRLLLVELLRPRSFRSSISSFVQDQLPMLIKDDALLDTMQRWNTIRVDQRRLLDEMVNVSAHFRVAIILVQLDSDVQSADTSFVLKEVLQAESEREMVRANTRSSKKSMSPESVASRNSNSGDSIDYLTLEQVNSSSIAQTVYQLIDKVQLSLTRCDNIVIELGRFAQTDSADALAAALKRLFEMMRWNAAKAGATNRHPHQRVILVHRGLPAPAHHLLLQYADIKVRIERYQSLRLADCVAQNAAVSLETARRLHLSALPHDVQADSFLQHVCVLHEICDQYRLLTNAGTSQTALRVENDLDVLLRQLVASLSSSSAPNASSRRQYVVELLELAFGNSFEPFDSTQLPSALTTAMYERIAEMLVLAPSRPASGSRKRGVDAISELLGSEDVYRDTLEALSSRWKQSGGNTLSAESLRKRLNDGVLLVLERRSIDAAAFAIEQSASGATPMSVTETEDQSSEKPAEAADWETELYKTCERVRSQLPFQISSVPNIAKVAANPDADAAGDPASARPSLLQNLIKLVKSLRTSLFESIDFVIAALMESIDKMRNKDAEAARALSATTAVQSEGGETAKAGDSDHDGATQPTTIVTSPHLEDAALTPMAMAMAAVGGADPSLYAFFVRMLLLFRGEVARYSRLLFVIHESVRQVQVESLAADLHSIPWDARPLTAECLHNLTSPFSSEDIDGVRLALIRNRVPRLWLREADLPLLESQYGESLDDWLREVSRCVSFFNFWTISFLRWCDDVRVPSFEAPVGRNSKLQADAALHDRGSSIIAAQQAANAGKPQLSYERLPFMPLPRAYWLPAFSSTTQLKCSIFDTASPEEVNVQGNEAASADEDGLCVGSEIDLERFLDVAFAPRSSDQVRTWSTWTVIEFPISAARTFGSFFQPF